MKDTTTIYKVIKQLILSNIVSIICLVIGLLCVVFLHTTKSVKPQLVFLNVGQGDAVLIQQDNFQILVDGGPDDSVVYELAKYMPWFDKEIEVMILTHPHEDHLAGLMLLLKKYTVKKILYSFVEYPNAGYQYLLSNYRDILEDGKAGLSIDYKDLHLTQVFPLSEKEKQDENINNESVILFSEIKGYKVLLMGDAEVEVEEKIAGYDFLGNIDVVKIGHHCSDTSSSEMFLTRTDPSIAVCSCGRKNKFGHPASETIQKLEESNVQYFITYLDGSILFNF